MPTAPPAHLGSRSTRQEKPLSSAAMRARAAAPMAKCLENKKQQQQQKNSGGSTRQRAVPAQNLASS